ncbi:MAG: DNA-binding protein Alba [Candidatus Syntropharchaeia archaeon]
MVEDNVIYIGNKPVMSYVLAVVTQFNDGSDEVVIKARGRAISRAVDTTEVVRKKFMPGVQLEKIEIGTEELEGSRGDKISVSSIEIYLKAPSA